MSFVMGPDDALKRDQKLEAMVAQYQHSLLRMCYMQLCDRQLAEDAVQETFIKAYRNLSAFAGKSSEKTWLMKIAINTCRDLNRSGWMRLMDRRYTPDMLPEAAAPFEEKEEELVIAVMQLPFKLREVILLHYYQGMGTIEIADSLGISQSSVSGRLKRARDKMRITLEGRGFYE